MINFDLIVPALRANLPGLLAVYVFGSHVQGTAMRHSDLDLAVLVSGSVDSIALWNLAQQLADKVNCDIDLVDLRAASTVLQYQIITTGKCLWAHDSQAVIYESFILSEKTSLDRLRADLLADIEQEGSVYGR